MVSEYSLVDGQSIIYFMSQYIFLDLLYARHGADAVGETGSKEAEPKCFKSFDKIIIGG